jgi:hypothetical protein
MANTLLTISMITNDSLMVLENELTATKHINREYDDRFGVSGAQIGTVLNVRKPPRYLGRVGQALQLEDATETSVPVALNTQRGVDIAFTSQDLALSIDDFSERFIRPAIANVANNIDFDVLGLFTQVSNEIGTPGTVPAALLTYLQAGQRLDEEAVPRDSDRAVVISPAMQATIVDVLKGLFHDSTSVAEQYRMGTMGRTIGFKWNMDQNVRVQTVGAYSPGGATVNGANQTGNSIITAGWPNTTAILNIGDIVTFAGCFAVNPQNRQSTGALRQFVVTANVVSSGGGAATIPIAGPGGLGVVTAGAFQTVSASPTGGGAVVVSGASGTGPSPRGLAFHKNFATLACADLPLPGGVDKAARASDDQLGLSIRMVRAYDIFSDRWPCRLDILYGVAVLYPEFACRIAS